jgi:hypothetical protein
MAKKSGSKAEWRRLLKFEQENEKLRKEVSKLRKQVRNGFVDELEERSKRVKQGKPAIVPTCETCGNEDIHFITIERKDGNFEMKVCRS